jgi:cellulose synthase operon protein C
VRRLSSIAAIALAAVFALPAQTLDQAETARKARRYSEANDIYRALVEREPKNANVRVRWGRMFLEYSQPGDAKDLFTEAIEIDKNCAGAYFGLALMAADGFDGQAAELAAEALKNDPKLTEAQELLARLALEDNDTVKATEEARKALQMDPNAVQAKAILATIDWLADKKDSSWDPKDARGYETAARFFVINRRYDEGIAFYRKAIAMDPQLYSARSQLGVNLMRMGQDEEAYKQLEECYNNSFRDDATRNSLKLLDTLKKFVTVRDDVVSLRMDKKESDLLAPYFQGEMKRIRAAYDKKYAFKFDGPLGLEVYPNHPDFEVRTLGLPGLGALGVTFGRTVAMDSPSSRKPGEFHWASTLWHEMSHVYTIALTNSHVPRWFTEGLAVHEETQVSPEWGDRLDPSVIEYIKGKKLLPISVLDRGFVHPKSAIQVGVSYFQAGKICDYIADNFGWPAIMAMLHDFAAGEETPAVVRKELKIEPEEFDKRFLAYVEAATKTPVEKFDEWRGRLKEMAAMAKEKDYDGVIREGLAIRDFYSDYVETGSVYEFLADAYAAKNDKASAMAQLDRYMKAGGRDPVLLKRQAQYLSEAGRKKEAAEALDRLNFIYPMDNEQHRTLGTLWLEQGNVEGAVREFAAVAAHNPIDPAEAHYQLANALFANHQTEKAQDEALTSLEAAPSYKPAQKLLLEINAAANAGTPGSPQKK